LSACQLLGFQTIENSKPRHRRGEVGLLCSGCPPNKKRAVASSLYPSPGWNQPLRFFEIIDSDEILLQDFLKPDHDSSGSLPNLLHLIIHQRLHVRHEHQ